MPVGEKTKLLWANPEYRAKMSFAHKGQKVWNKGLKGVQSAWNKGKRYEQIEGERHFAWKGDGVKYSGVHMWIRRKYGKASRCENLSCKGISQRFHWAKLRDGEYKRGRENFAQLCQSCHQKYDRDLNFEIEFYG